MKIIIMALSFIYCIVLLSILMIRFANAVNANYLVQSVIIAISWPFLFIKLLYNKIKFKN